MTSIHVTYNLKRPCIIHGNLGGTAEHKLRPFLGTELMFFAMATSRAAVESNSNPIFIWGLEFDSTASGRLPANFRKMHVFLKSVRRISREKKESNSNPIFIWGLEFDSTASGRLPANFRKMHVFLKSVRHHPPHLERRL